MDVSTYPWKTITHLLNIVSNLAADDLVMQEDRASAAMVLT